METDKLALKQSEVQGTTLVPYKYSIIPVERAVEAEEVQCLVFLVTLRCGSVQ